MDKILLLMVIAGDPQIIQPMDSAADCLSAAQLVNQVHEKNAYMRPRRMSW